MAQVKVVIKLNDSNNTVIEADNKNIENLSSLVQGNPDPSMPNFGTYANSGSITILDTNEKIKDIIQGSDFDPSNVSLEIYLNGNKVQEHISQDTNYNVLDNTLAISLTNKISLLDNDNIYVDMSGSFSNVYKLAREILITAGFSDDEIESAMSKSIVSGNDYTLTTVKDYLSNIKVPYGYLDQSGIQEAIDKLCQVGQLYVIIDDNGKLFIDSSRPLISQKQVSNAIRITKDKVYEDLNYSVIPQNKVNGITYTPISTGMEYKEYLENIITTEVFDIDEIIGNEPLNANYPNYQIYKYSGRGINDHLIIQYTAYPQLDSKYKNIEVLSEIGYQFTYIDSSGEQKTSGGELMYEYDSVEEFADAVINNRYTFWAAATEFGSTVFNINQPKTYFFAIPLSQTTTKIANNISISIGAPVDLWYANQYNNVSTGSSNYDIGYNELIQVNGTYKLDGIADALSNIIKSDYGNGVNTATITVCCGDFYDKNGNLVVDWDNGEIIKFGDVIFLTDDKNFDGSQRYWKVTGREIVYDYAPMLKLELASDKVVQSILPAGLFDKDDNLIYSWDSLIENGLIQVIDNSLNYVSPMLNGKLIMDSYTSTIGQEAFSNCSQIYSITISDGITNIGQNAFMNCTGLSEVHISNLDTWISIDFDISLYSNPLYYAKNLYIKDELLTNLSLYDNTVVKPNAFRNCESLQTLVFNGAVDVGNNAFIGCSNLSGELIIPDGSTIGEYSFNGCSKLETIYIGASVIKYASFRYCSKLKSVTISNNVSEIDSKAFESCRALEKIHIPDSVTTIIPSATLYSSSPFYDCPYLSIFCTATNKPNGWGQYWNYVSASRQASTYWGWNSLP